ncbi:MAG: T9SS type A sorting domain-containing protein [Bacteroidota bacterium]
MKKGLIVFVLCLFTASAYGQMIKRTDAIWARKTSNPITLDGKLDEADWAKAESVVVVYGTTPIMPGSGYSYVKGSTSDSSRVTLKYLVSGDSLYMAAIVPDSSIGGKGWEEFDSFLMSIRKHELPDRPSPSFEYFYGWIEWDPITQGAGAPPSFFGHAGGKRTDSTGGVPNWRIWDAATFVDGTSNSDTNASGQKVADKKWTTEYKFNLKQRGYNVNAANGDIVEMTISIFDADWFWAGKTEWASGAWTWFQGRWGGDPFYNVLRIHVNSSVTTNSGAAPAITQDVTIKNGSTQAKPVIDGKLDENVWKGITPLRLTFGDEVLRASYPGVGPYRSGERKFKADTVSAEPDILDPVDANVKYFFRGDTLYFGIEVMDQILTRGVHTQLKDWVRVTITKRDSTNPDHVLKAVDLDVTVVDTGAGYVVGGYLRNLKDSVNGAWVGVTKKGSFTNFANADTGYTVELAIDLKKLGYPAGRGDGVVFFGVTVHDGDSLLVAQGRSYADHVWFFSEGAASNEAPFKNGTAPAWGYMDPNSFITGVEDNVGAVPGTFELFGNYPNPFNPATKIEFTVPTQSNVRLVVYDLLGRVVAKEVMSSVAQGRHTFTFNANRLSSGVYFYQVQLLDAATNNVRDIKSSKMLLMK